MDSKCFRTEVNMDIGLQEITRTLIESVKLTLNSVSSYEERLKAFEYVEKIKDDYRYALPCGFFLSSSEDPEVIHFGLQLLEDTIRYHWNDLPANEKLLIKNSSMELVAKGTENLAAEQIYIKDKISRLIVEMMKREWPQQWPTLLEELNTISQSGPTQAELVLLILLRIAEDVEMLQKENYYNRRRDIYFSLNSSMDFLFDLFFNLLEVHYTKYKLLEQQQNTLASLHCRVTQVIYMTLSGFVEWVPMVHIMTHQRKLFTSICLLICDKNIRQCAAECFLRVVSRKSERKQLLILFDKDVMEAVFSAAQLSVMDTLSEENYLFLKTLFQVLTKLGSQLCLVWNKEPDVKEPETFGIYLNAVLAFMHHPSLTIYSYCNVLMLQLLKHEQAMKTKAFLDMVPLWIPVAFSKLRKNGYPSKRDNEESKYSALDFDSDSEYAAFFIQVRNVTVDTIRQAVGGFPDLCFAHAEEWFNKCLMMPIENETTAATYPTPVETEWNALTSIFDAVIPRLARCQFNSYKPPIDRIRSMIQQCLKYDCQNPNILSLLLSCISAVCSFLAVIPEVKEDVLRKLFSCFRFSLSSSEGTVVVPDRKAVFLLRNHACASLVKLCRNHTKEFINSLDLISSTISNIPDLITAEKGMLFQAQVSLINEINNFDTQQIYLSKLIVPYKEEWMALSENFNGTHSLIRFLGLDKPPSKICDTLTPVIRNRSTLWKCLTVFLSVIKQLKAPRDRLAANADGSVVSDTDSRLVRSSPAAQFILPLLPSFFSLSKSLNSLSFSESLSLHSEEYAKAHDIPLLEVKTMLNLHSQESVSDFDNIEESSQEKMKLYMRNVFEQLCHILGNVGYLLGEEFYKIPHLQGIVIQSVFSNFTALPDFKIRFIFKGFYKLFLCSCPQELYESVALPVIHHVTISMMNHLNSRWEYVSKVIQCDDYDEDATDTKEMIDLTIIQIMTRDYLNIVKDLLINRTVSNGSVLEEANEEPDENMMEGVEVSEQNSFDIKSTTGHSQDVLSPLGRLMFRCDPICQALVLTFSNALSWNDSMSSLKANLCLQLCLQAMFEECQQHLNEEAVKHIFVAVLMGIHTHGRDAQNLVPLVDTAIMLYEKLAPHFPIIKSTMLSAPAVKETDLNRFEQLLVNLNTNTKQKKPSKQEKIKRDAFKKVIEGVISKNLSEAFRREVHIKDLTPVFQKPRDKQPRLDEGSGNLNLCHLFGPNA